MYKIKIGGITLNRKLANHLSANREALLHNWFNGIRSEDSVHYRSKTDAELLPSLGKIFDSVVTYLNSGDNSEVNDHIQKLVGRRIKMYILDELLMSCSASNLFEECVQNNSASPSVFLKLSLPLR